MPNVFEVEVNNATTPLTVELPEGGKLRVKYRSWLWTPEFTSRADMSAPWDSFPRVIEWWDLTLYKNLLEWMEARKEREERLLALRQEIIKQANDKGKEADAVRKKFFEEADGIRTALADEIRPKPDPESGEVPYPIETWAIRYLPSRTMNAITNALMADQIPNSETREDD